MVVRPLTPQDNKLVLQLVGEIEADQGLHPGFYWPSLVLEGELWETSGWGAFLGNELMAFVLYRQPEGTGVLEISTLATSLRHRRQGAMEVVLKKLIDSYGQEREIWLEVHSENLAAQNLYKKLGFREVGRRPRYYRDGSEALLYSFSGPISG